MKVHIDCDKRVKFRGSDEYEGGWYYREALPNDRYEEYTDDYPPKSERAATYAEIKAKIVADGHEWYNAGWKRRMLSWNWYSLSFNKYEDWEIVETQNERDGQRWTESHPAFVKLAHRHNKDGDVESSVLCNAWDDMAEADFYQRDWTDDGIPFVDDDEVYWSGWWFATVAERDRFVAWVRGTINEKFAAVLDLAG